MNSEDYHNQRIRLQVLQARFQFAQVVIQATTLIATLILLGSKL